MGSELDLDDAIASILADSDGGNGLSKKKRTSSKKKLNQNKSGKSLKSKALTSSVSEEDFYKNLSKIAEEQNKDDETDDVIITEEDAKKMASDLAALDDLDSDLLGSLGRKTKPLSPRSKQTNGQDNEKQKDFKRKSSSGSLTSLHRKGSVIPLKGEGDDDDILGDLGLTDDESEDALNSSVNSTRSRHRRTSGSKKSPNKISPRVSHDDLKKDAKSDKASKAKEINVNYETQPAAKSTGKKPVKNRREKKKTPKDDADLFGEDDDLPDLDGEPEDKSQRSESPAKRTSSALDNLMGSKSKATSRDSTKKTPASLDEFMAKVSTSSQPQVKSDSTQGPILSPTAEETFQFGGYMPSAAAGTGRRSRSNRPESSQEFGRRSVKFSDDLGLDDDAFGVKKRPSTAPGGRNRKDDELGIDDPFTRSLPGKSDNSDWLGLEDEIEQSGGKKSPRETKADDFSPQASLQGSKSSMSGDWLGLGEDATVNQFDINPQSGVADTKQEVTPERTSPRQQKFAEKTDDELTKMLDMVPDENNNAVITDNKFPWNGGKKSGGRRRRSGVADAPSLKQESQKSELDNELQTETRQERNLKVNHPVSDQTSGSPSGPVPSTTSHTVPNNRSPKTTPAVDPARGGTVQQQSRRRSDGHTAATPNSPLQQPYSRALARPGFEGHYQSGLDKQRNEMEVELRGMMGKVQEMDKRKHEVELELANKVAELETKIRWLEVENENFVKTSELSKERHKDEVSALENSHRLRIQGVEESYRRREARQNDETEMLITKQKESIRQMEADKSDLQAANARKISAFESSKLNEIERLNNLHLRALDELRNEHQAEMEHLKKMKEQEVSATVTAFSHTKSLQTLMEQVLNSTKQVDDLHHLVEVSHKTSQQERDMTAKVKDEYLDQLHNRLLKQQAENEGERSRLQNLVAKMEIHVREQNRRLEEDKWKLNQEESRLKSTRASLEEERKITREQLEAERVLVQRTKQEFLSEQKRMMIEGNEERRTLSLERAELTAAQRGIINTEKQKHVNFTKMDIEQESERIRLAEDTAAVNAQETRLKRDQDELSREKREFTQKQEQWNTEKEHIGKLGLEVEKRAQEMEEVSLEAAKAREVGTKSLETAQKMQLDIAKQANELESNVLLLQEKERQIAAERLAIIGARRELEEEKRRGLCPRCSQLSLAKETVSNGTCETPPRPLFTSEASPSSTLKSKVEVVSSPPATSALPLTPDLLVNTLELKRTFRRWSQDKEQDEEFLAKESEFLSSLHNSRQHSKSNTRYSAVS